MEIKGRTVLVTGAASGIGLALVEAFAAADAARIIAVDVDPGVGAVADRHGAEALVADLAHLVEVDSMVARVLDGGPIDILCSNAGLFGGMCGLEADEATWDALWQVNVLAHVRTSRALLPQMRARGEGYLVNTASAAGLVTNLGALPYSVTKHAAVALAEWLAITYGREGIRVSCVCPMGVDTPMLAADNAGGRGSPTLDAGNVLSPQEVATCVVDGIRAEEMLILPHPKVARHMAVRGGEHARWLAAVSDLDARLARERAASTATD